MTPFVAIRPLERMLLIGLLLVLSVGSIGAALSSNDYQIVVAGAFVTYALVLMLPFFWRDRTLGWFHPVIFMVVWWEIIRYVLPRLSIAFSGLVEHRLMVGVSAGEINLIAALGFFLTAIGLLAFYAGFLLTPTPRKPIAPRPPHVIRPRGTWHFFVTACIVGISALALLVLIREAGGLGNMLLQRGMARDMRVGAELGGAHWHFLVKLAPTACLVWLAFDHRIWKSPKFIGLFVLALAMGFIATGSRGGIIGPIMMATAIWSIRERRLPYAAAAIGVVFALLIIGAGGQWRSLSFGAGSIEDIQFEISPLAHIESGFETTIRIGNSLDGLSGILYSVPSHVDHLYGASYLSVLTAPFPSALLPFDKPMAGGRLNGTLIYGVEAGIPPGNIGEAFWNFHLFGIVFIMGVFGACLKLVTMKYLTSDRGPIWTTIFIFTIFYLQPNSQAIINWLYAVAPALFFLFIHLGVPKFLATSRTRSRAAA